MLTAAKVLIGAAVSYPADIKQPVHYVPAVVILK